MSLLEGKAVVITGAGRGLGRASALHAAACGAAVVVNDTWLPGLVPDGQNITLRMLLNHTSGLFNYLDDPAVLKAFTGQDTRQWTPEEALATAVAHPPLFAPGTQYSYSNTNYLLLGLIAEKVTHKDLADVIQQRIARPLHLRNTYLVTGADRRHNPTLAHGYEPDADRLAPLLPPGTPPGTAFVGPGRPDGYVDTTNVNLSTEWAAGAMVSTAQDWARFQSALLSGKLLPPTELQQMKTTVPEGPDTPDRRYGLGLEKVVTPCGTVWGHARSCVLTHSRVADALSQQAPSRFHCVSGPPSAGNGALTLQRKNLNLIVRALSRSVGPPTLPRAVSR